MHPAAPCHLAVGERQRRAFVDVQQFGGVEATLVELAVLRIARPADAAGRRQRFGKMHRSLSVGRDATRRLREVVRPGERLWLADAGGIAGWKDGANQPVAIVARDADARGDAVILLVAVDAGDEVEMAVEQLPLGRD